MSGKGPVFVFSDSYQIASELAFYMQGHPVTYCVNLGRRMNQYDLWPGFENLRGQNAIFISARRKKKVPEKVAEGFSSCDQWVVQVKPKKKKTLQFSVTACYDFKGFASQKPETF